MQVAIRTASIHLCLDGLRRKKAPSSLQRESPLLPTSQFDFSWNCSSRLPKMIRRTAISRRLQERLSSESNGHTHRRWKKSAQTELPPRERPSAKVNRWQARIAKVPV